MSGEIGFIDNRSIRKSIFDYYQQNMRSLEEIEKINNTKTIEVGELMAVKKSYKDIYADRNLIARVEFLKQSAKAIIDRYDKNIKSALIIIEEIEKPER